MTNPAFNEKTAARRLSEMTGHSYQKCLTALRSQDLGPLFPNPAGVYPATVVDTAAAGLVMGGAHPTPHDAKVELLTTSLTAAVRSHHPDATSAVIWMDDDEFPAVGVLSAVRFGDDTELDAFGEPAGDAAMVWAALLGDVLELPRGDGHEVVFPPLTTQGGPDRVPTSAP